MKSHGKSLAAAIAIACGSVLPVFAADSEIEAIRNEVRQMKESYENRIQALEQRLRQAEAKAQQAETSGRAQTAQPKTAVAPESRAAATTSAFNPEISVILQGAFNKREGGERHISGFFEAGEHAHSERGFTLDHSEVVMSANIDPYFRGHLNLALADDEIEVEEAWFQSLSIGRGLTIKGGRFLSGIGYQNEQHPHAWDFADNNLMYSVLFGEHLIQDGLQIKWLAPTPIFLEFGAEAARGQFFPGSDEGGDKNGAGAWAAFAHIGGDAGVSHSWRTGLSYLRARPQARHAHVDDINDTEAHTDFTGTSKAWLADFVWKWAPNGNATERNFKFQAEYFRRKESGSLLCEDNSAQGGACADIEDAFSSKQSGWYAQGVFQFMPRWRVGLRFDQLNSGSIDFGANDAFIEGSDYKPSKTSLMLDFSPSEFSRLRFQVARDKSMQGDADNQFSLQYIHSLGAHGAHKF